MTAKQLDLTIEQGADFAQVFPVVDANGNSVDVTGATASLQIRTAIGNPTALVTLSTSAGSLVLNLSVCTITASIPASVTAALLPGAYVYDLKMTSSTGAITRLYQGNANVSAEVTV